MGKNKKVAYFEGRPKGHPTHSLYAKSVSADFYFFDLYLRYHDKGHTNKLRMMLSWCFTALFFPKMKYEVFLTEEPYFFIYLIDKLFPFLKNKKVSILGTHTLYFIKQKRFSKLGEFFTKKAISAYDCIICEGEMQKQLLIDLMSNGKQQLNVKCIHNGSNKERLKILKTVKWNGRRERIVTIAGFHNIDRFYYKGIDQNIKVFSLLINRGYDLYYDIIGEYNKEIVNDILSKYDKSLLKRITFLGRDDSFQNRLGDYVLSLHLSRGEAWGICVNDCMAAGIPVIVSYWTGSKQIVEKVDSNLVIPELNMYQNATNIIQEVLEMDEELFSNLKEKSREVALYYNESYAVEKFCNIFYEES